jgi:acetyl-CoA C-acetyltransferase
VRNVTTPVIIGVGQYVHRDDASDQDLAAALEPTALMERAVLAACDDAGLDGPPAADAVRVVAQLSWRYTNTPRSLARRLGIEPRRLEYTTMGGNSPQTLVNQTALDIQAGRVDLAILAGGEATHPQACPRRRRRARLAPRRRR